MAIIGRATSRSAPGIARVYVDSWRMAYAGILPDRVLKEDEDDDPVGNGKN